MDLNPSPSRCVKVYADLLRKTTRLLTKNNNNKEYARLQFIDGTDTDNIPFYNASICTF